MKRHGDHTRGAASDSGPREDRIGARRKPRRAPEDKARIRELKGKISRKREERSRMSRDLRVARLEGSRSDHLDQLKSMKGIKQELFLLEQQLRAVRERDETYPETGALPDFAIIGAPKCGTTFLYHLLSKHSHVEPAAFKEPHFFDSFFDKGIEWYRRCFPPARLKDGRKTITGEATPGYLAHPDAPERMAEIVPAARLIALLRNPVDRIYSGYHFFGRRRGRSVLEFEEYAEAALDDPGGRILSKGIYVDQLLRWSRRFSKEQMLVVKSENFFENPRDTLKVALDFLELPAWEPDASELREKRNRGAYEQGMEQDTRRQLREYYEPHNQRLYEYLGVDFGW